MRNKLQSFAAVTAANAGFHAVAGPFGVNSSNKRTKARDQAYRDSALADQLKACPHAKIVDHYGKAWIIRKKPLELDNGKRHKLIVSGDLGIATWRPVKR